MLCFRGHYGIGISEWTEEVQVSMRTRHLGLNDQACFIYDQGEARDEIKYRPSNDQQDPEGIFMILWVPKVLCFSTAKRFL